MKRIFLQLKQLLRNERGEITFFACFFVVGIVMLISFLLLYASIPVSYTHLDVYKRQELRLSMRTVYWRSPCLVCSQNASRGKTLSFCSTRSTSHSLLRQKR